MIGVGIIRVVQESLVRQGVEERLQLCLLQIGELHAAVHHVVHQRVDVLGVFHALAVKVDDFIEGGETPVVHVRTRHGDVA